jgi:predicted DNA-binding ribbon-helix-helix protein
MGVLVKRSFTLAGHRTSVALEPEFWQALAAFAAFCGRSVAAVVAEVDSARPPERPLASALRVHALTAWRTRADAEPASR